MNGEGRKPSGSFRETSLFHRRKLELHKTLRHTVTWTKGCIWKIPSRMSVHVNLNHLILGPAGDIQHDIVRGNLPTPGLNEEKANWGSRYRRKRPSEANTSQHAELKAWPVSVTAVQEAKRLSRLSPWESQSGVSEDRKLFPQLTDRCGFHDKLLQDNKKWRRFYNVSFWFFFSLSLQNIFEDDK